MKLISHQLGAPNAEIDRTVQIVDQKLNEKIVEGGSAGCDAPPSRENGAPRTMKVGIH